jgi:nuclear pore complex protein Nup98-Nup96
MQSIYFSILGSANHQEIWEITSALENHKSEIADWDLGAGIYIDFYILKNSMQEGSVMDDLV